MIRRTRAVPRSTIFTLEDGSWVVQRGVDQVQDMLSGQMRRFSSMDSSYEITDLELEMMEAQGLISQYDSFFVWLTGPLADFRPSEAKLGSITYYCVTSDLSLDERDVIEDYLENAGLSDRYTIGERFGLMTILGPHEEPFLRLSSAENAQTLLSPFLQTLNATMTVEMAHFDASYFAVAPHVGEHHAQRGLVRRRPPHVDDRTLLCIDSDPDMHVIFSQVCEELGIEFVAVATGKQGIMAVQDVDPDLVVMDLSLPDMHGYEVVAAVRTDPDLAHTPIIITTALESETDRALAYTVAGVIDYVLKPLDVNDIRRRVWRELHQKS